jgi:hypothetical protein
MLATVTAAKTYPPIERRPFTGSPETASSSFPSISARSERAPFGRSDALGSTARAGGAARIADSLGRSGSGFDARFTGTGGGTDGARTGGGTGGTVDRFSGTVLTLSRRGTGGGTEVRVRAAGAGGGSG